jgi:hypothetical protein
MADQTSTVRISAEDVTQRAIKSASDNLRRLADQASRASAQNIALTRGQEKSIMQAARNTGRT